MIMQRLFHDRSVRTAFFACFTLAVTAAEASAQEFTVAQADGGAPRFLVASSRGEAPVPVDAGSIPALGRRINLNLSDVTIDEALRAIGSASRLQLVYSAQVVPLTKRVSVQATRITVAAALTEVLFRANVDVLLSGGRIVMVRGRQPLQVGAITGHVTDSVSREGVGGVTIAVEGTRLSTTTATDGSYTIRRVPAGNRTISARRLGFVRQSRTVTVTDNESITVDFVLAQAPTTLSEVVTTATGDQRRVELGHVVGRINADSIVRAAPVSSMSELLNGRVTGLQVNTQQGTVGGQVSLRLRSPNTIALDRDPIVVVDGVRYTSLSSLPNTILSSVSAVEPTSPLNDLNANAIESIEVVKGPSAATLYGTDAANGVIVIRTKRGVTGAPRWQAYTKAATTAVAAEFPNHYWGWSDRPSVILNCDLNRVASGACNQDSVTVFISPLNDAQRTIFDARPRWEYGANVSGGSRDLRYFLAVDLEQATGPLRMPPGLADSLLVARGLSALPKEQQHPNAFTKINLRSSTTIGLGAGADLLVNAGYVRRATRAFGMNNPYLASANVFGPEQEFGQISPADFFSRTSTERVSRFLGSATANWNPLSWLVMRATGGLDLSSSERASLALRGEAGGIGFGTGAVGDDRGRQVAMTGELGATAALGRNWLSSRTSAGAQYVRTVNDLLVSAGSDLPPGGSSIGEAASVQADRTYREQVTLGSYIEEMVGINDRLFLTGALRADGASTFGRDYDVAIYPKAGASWLLSEEPMLPSLPFLEELRLRYAFGASGQQPRPEWARPEYEVRQVFVDGAVVNSYRVNALGNPNLRPERVREHEFGFDVSAFGHRLGGEFTWFRRETVDQIVTVDQPPGLGRIRTNLGRTTGAGFEAQVQATLVQSALITWNVALLRSFHRTTLEELGGAAERREPSGGWVEGYPIGARFVRPLVGFNDANGDGIIASSELQYGDSVTYLGESTPPRSLTLTSNVALLNGRVRLSALAERRSGFTQLNALGRDRCSNRICRAAVDRSASLADQAKAVASYTTGGFGSVWIEPGDYTRLREVAVSVDVPPSVARALRLSSATVTLQGRNIALWTAYGGADPESASIGSFTVAEFGIPQGRSWGLRVDVGL